jgi:hypothetical protein
MRRLLLILLLASPAFADTATQKREGDYGGVVPGQKPDPSTKPAKPKRAPAKGTLTWIGFEAKEGGAVLFFQAPGPFEVSQKIVGSSVVATLNLTKLAANTWRQIDTRFFDNPLSGVIAKGPGRRGKARTIEVHINFKNPKDVHEGTLRTATEADGMFYAYLTFPEGTATAAPATPTKDEPDK